MEVFINILKRTAGVIPVSPIKFFVIASLLFGLGFAALVPPFQNPDEFAHLTRAYEVSKLQTSHRHLRPNKLDLKGSELPTSILLTNKDTRIKGRPGDIDVPQAKKYYLGKTRQAFKIPLNKEKTTLYNTGSSPAYVPLIYAPQAMTIKVLEVFNMPVIGMLYALRILNLVIWISLAALAIKIMEPRKYRLALAGGLLVPMFLTQAATTGVDALLTGVTVIFLALSTRYIALKTNLNLKRIGLLTALLTVMVLAKPVYIALGLLVFVMKTKYRGLSSLSFKSVALGVPLIAYMLWAFITKDRGGKFYEEVIESSHANPALQVGYLNPDVTNFFQPLINTLLLGWGDGVVFSLIGTFGKLDTPLPLLFIIIGYIVVLTAIFAKPAEKTSKLDVPERNLLQTPYLWQIGLLAASIAAFGIYLSMYVYSTPPEAKIITGVQGRYFLPLLPLFILIIPKSMVLMKASLYRFILTVLPVLVLICSLVVIYLRFYIHYPQ